jgi:hypothetical protein
MVDPEGQPEAAQPEAAPPDAAPPDAAPPDVAPLGDWPAVAYWAAASPPPSRPGELPPTQPPPEPPPTQLAPGPPALPWTRAYELPTARKVVSSGLQLAVASSAPIRRASIYIGLLVLGAFGPAILAILLTLGRLGDQGLELLGTALFAPEFAEVPDPALQGVILALALVLLLGLLLFMAISIDAQVIAIALLGARASDQPLRLWEAIVRARQTFWRMVGAGSVVGLVSLFIQLVLLSVFASVTSSQEAVSLVTSLIVTVILAPFAYVSAGIVLGDVGAMEALSRSWRLYNARKRLALVVVLFTLITSAIQLFALGAGLDLVFRAGELLDVSLTEGALAFATAAALILATVVAYGSLTFTIGAIVSAPQVTGFLGLTFFSGGLDKARADAARPPKGFRWVTRPMLAVMAAIALLTAVEVPAINSIVPPPVDPIVGWVRGLAAERPELIDVYGTPAVVDDPASDVVGVGAGVADIVLAEYAFVPDVPDWLIEDGFDCANARVACSAGDRGTAAFENGALLFLHRASVPVDTDPSGLAAVALLAVEGDRLSPRDPEEPFAAASHAFVVSLGSESRVEALEFNGTRFAAKRTSVRATWSGADVFTIVPFDAYRSQPIGWDVVLLQDGGSGVIASRDTIRAEPGGRLRDWDFAAWLYVDVYE